MSKRTSLCRHTIVCLSWLALLLAAVAPASAQTTPARPVPQQYWPNSDTLKPVDPDPLPTSRDSTGFQDNRDGSPRGSSSHPGIWPFFQAVEAEGGFLYTGLSHGVQVWDPSADPESPTLVGQVDWKSWPRYCGQFEIQHVLQDMAVPKGDGTVAGVTAVCDVGFAVVDTTNRAAPRVAYQDDHFSSTDVYAVRIGTTSYAYVATDAGLRLYNMTRAKQFNGCLDSAEGCQGVHVTTLGTGQSFLASNGVDNFLATAQGGDGVSIFDISQPASPSPRLTASFSQVLNGQEKAVAVSAVDMWKAGGQYYLAFVTQPFISGQGIVPTLQVYNVNCIRTGFCSLGSPLRTIQTRSGSLASSLQLASGTPTLTVSSSNGLRFLYVGSTNRFSGGAQREWLLDVSTPEILIDDITPPTRRKVDGVDIGYWGWYYNGNPTGFRNIAPNQGVFLGDYFYRAAFAIFDIHKRLGASPPVADFEFTSLESDGRVYPGSTVRFEDRSGGAPDLWEWTFQDGNPPFRSGDFPNVDVQFDSPGNKTVSLTASNSSGSSDLIDSVSVLPPEPSVGGVQANVQTATECQTITLSANDVVGKPPLSYEWTILNDTQTPQVGESVSGDDTATWFVSQGRSGTFTAQVNVSNAFDPAATASSAPLTITALEPLPQAGFPIDDPVITNGVVEFHVDAPGATEWRWDFGDGTTPTWTSDPVNGPNPVHTYAEEGTYQVTVEVRNCKGGPVLSTAREVFIDSVVELHAEFVAQLQCTASFCSAEEGQTVQFDDRSTGAQLWEYDWDGDGDFEASSAEGPITSHRYASIGNFRPVLRVSRRDGAEVDVFTHRVIVVEGPTPPPTVRVTGPRAGETGTNHSFSASCSGVGSLGWSWSANGGGTFVGSRTGSVVQIRWGSTGIKTVTASHSGCTSGSTRITISNPTGPDPDPDPGGAIRAAFNFTPSRPQTGQAVTFDASASTGSPQGYIWDFGDGSPTGTGVRAQHTYTEPGSYQVMLTVSKQGSGAGCRLGVCIDELSKVVVVSGGGPGPDPEPEPEPGAVCSDDPNAFCLLDGRFKIEVDWRNHHDGGSEGIGKPVTPTPLANQDTTGFYWFFNPDSTDLIVKVIDGSTVNDNFWFFYGALTDVEYTITVTDQVTGVSQEYHNDPGNVCGRGDVRAFPFTAEPPPDSAGGWRVGSFDGIHQADGPSDDPEPEPEPDNPPTSGACQPAADTLCLLDGRFEAKVHFKDQINSQEGDGTAIRGTDQTGYFWFFEPSNVELVIKAIDATGFNGHFWFFYGALTTVEYDIVVTDTETGAQNVYHNDPDNICGQADTKAFEP